MPTQGFPRDACKYPPHHDEFMKHHTNGSEMLTKLWELEEETDVYMKKQKCVCVCARAAAAHLARGVTVPVCALMLCLRA